MAPIFRSGSWTFLDFHGELGRFDFKVDAIAAFPLIVKKLRRRGRDGEVRLLVQQRWGEMSVMPAGGR